MNQNFQSYLQTSGTDDDKVVNTSLTIFPTSENIYFSLTKETQKRTPGGDYKTTLEEEMTIEELNEEVVVKIKDTLNTWVESGSKPTLIETFPEVSGHYSRQRTSSGYSRNPVGDSGTEEDFEGLTFVVGRKYLCFQLSASGGDRGIDIPAAEEILRGASQDVSNLTLAKKTFNDFFAIELSDADDFADVDSSVLDNELESRCLSEYESAHYQSAVRTAFTVLEERIRNKGEFPQRMAGAELALQAFNSDDGALSFGETEGEQDGVMFLYRGAFQALRNPVSHRFVEDIDEEYARDAIHTVNLLLRLLEENTS